MTEPDIKLLLQNSRVIAVVGFSLKPERASHYVTRYLHQAGYTVLPINPGHGGQPSGIADIPVYDSMASAIRASGQRPDIVDVFRRSEDVGPAVSDAIEAGAGAVWMQQGIRNEDEAQRARAAGLQVVMDRCIKVDHMMLIGYGAS